MPISAEEATTMITTAQPGFDVAGVYLLPNRPWFSLYGLRLSCSGKNNEQSQIQTKLPHEVMLNLFARLGPYGMGVASCVCRQWNILANQPQLWYKACLEAFPSSTRQENIDIVKAQYSSSWKKMFLERPHLRFDGMYVARNTYLRTGVVEWRERKAVHLVTYFRYLRFSASGSFRYCTTPVIPRKVAGFLGCPISTIRKGKEPVTLMAGTYDFNEGYTKCTASFPNAPHIRFCIEVRLRSTTRGAHNRLDVERITTAEIGVDPEADEEEEEIEINEELEHSRGLAPFVFVPWEKVDDCIFNQPAELDYHIA